MNIVFCVDRGVLPGLHVAAYSLLDRIGPAAGETYFSVFSDVLDEADMALLRETLTATGKPFSLELRRLDPASLTGFPMLNGSLAAYYRLLAAQVMDVDRFLYVDADTLCDVDVSELQALDMGDVPAGWVPEAPLAYAIDRDVAVQLGNSKIENYFNSGVMLLNVNKWRRQQVTEKALEYLKHQPAAFWDQSALNVVLYRKAFKLDAKFNCMSNMRKNWPTLKLAYGQLSQLVHFLDYPKPWSLMSEFVHPQYELWRTVLRRTAMKDYHSWHNTPARKFSMSAKVLTGYKKIIKDQILFSGYSRGWIKRVKGVHK